MVKKYIILLPVLLSLAVISLAQTPGTLTVTATTSSAGGNYAPRNIVAIWVEDDQGNFVKTLMAYAQTRRTHLNNWEASTTAAGSAFNTVDAITGPTRNSHATRTCTWGATDIEGNIVDDGPYFLWMELTDKNGTGNFSSFSFSKNEMAQTLTPLNVPSFSSISIAWEPTSTSTGDKEMEDNIKIYPNPTPGFIHVSGEKILEIKIRNSAGKEIKLNDTDIIDISDQPDGLYLIEIVTEKGQFSDKILKNSK